MRCDGRFDIEMICLFGLVCTGRICFASLTRDLMMDDMILIFRDNCLFVFCALNRWTKDDGNKFRLLNMMNSFDENNANSLSVNRSDNKRTF